VILSDMLFVVFWLHVYESVYTVHAVLNDAVSMLRCGG
jgi:hypothetical protein